MESAGRQRRLATIVGTLTLPPGVAIREWEVADFGTVQRLAAAEGWSTPTERPDEYREAWRQSWPALVAVASGSVVGFLRALSDGVVTTFVAELLVAPGWRGRGIAAALLETSQRLCPGSRLELLATEASQGYYARSGFRPFFGFRLHPAARELDGLGGQPDALVLGQVSPSIALKDGATRPDVIGERGAAGGLAAKEVVLILGGARSGKSAFAERLARERGGATLYVATAEAGDEEMARRIAAHRAGRPPDWRTLEAPLSPAARLAEDGALAGATTVLLDCLTLLVSNLLLAHEGAGEEEVARRVEAEIDALLLRFDEAPAGWVIVSNEVGLGLVPPYPLGRIYRDLLGRVNQRIATRADRVYLLVAGLPIDLKALASTSDVR